MKLQNIIWIILVFVLLGSCKKQKTVLMHGRVIGGNIQGIEYTTPINGKWFYGSKKKISTDSMGLFTIQMDVEKPSFITLYIPGKTSGIVLIEPGKTYDVKFNLDEKQTKFHVKAEDSVGQNFYNTLKKPDFFVSLNEFYNDSIPEEMSSKINSLKKTELLKFAALLSNNDISKDFYELAVLDREVYYSALEAGSASWLLQKYLIEKSASKIDKLLKFWAEKLKVSNITGINYDRSPWYYFLASNRITFSQLSSADFDLEKMIRIHESGDIYQYQFNEAKKYLGKKELEYYLSSNIYYESWQTKDNSKKIIEVYENFRKEYPQSVYNGYLESSIKPIVTFHKNLENLKPNEKIRFVQNYKEIKNFDDLISKLKGKKIFIDIWGTWCGPCRKEFEHKKALEQLLKSKDITPLYICEGKYSKEKIWNEMIAFYGLEGYHIFANEKLVADITSRFSNNGISSYPRYILLDGNGRVVNANASYPSEIKQLEKEISENYVL